MEKLQEHEEPTLRELQEELSRLRGLVTHEGYRYLMQIAAAQVSDRRGFELEPLKGLDEIFKQEFIKGEIAGISLFMELADIRINNLEEDIKVTMEVDKEESDDEHEHTEG